MIHVIHATMFCLSNRVSRIPLCHQRVDACTKRRNHRRLVNVLPILVKCFATRVTKIVAQVGNVVCLPQRQFDRVVMVHYIPQPPWKFRESLDMIILYTQSIERFRQFGKTREVVFATLQGLERPREIWQTSERTIPAFQCSQRWGEHRKARDGFATTEQLSKRYGQLRQTGERARHALQPGQ
jgi:hypothetical protein